MLLVVLSILVPFIIPNLYPMNENVRKSWTNSKTVISSLIALIAFVLQYFGVVELTTNESQQLIRTIGDVVLGLVELGGILGAIYGRFKVNTKLKAPMKFLEAK